jgi:hypothetical protein
VREHGEAASRRTRPLPWLLQRRQKRLVLATAISAPHLFFEKFIGDDPYARSDDHRFDRFPGQVRLMGFEIRDPNRPQAVSSATRTSGTSVSAPPST